MRSAACSGIRCHALVQASALQATASYTHFCRPEIHGRRSWPPHFSGGLSPPGEQQMSVNRLAWIVIAAVAMLGFAADTVGARTLDEIVKSGTIKVGVNPDAAAARQVQREERDRWLRRRLRQRDRKDAGREARNRAGRLAGPHSLRSDRQDRLRHGSDDAHAGARQGDRLHGAGAYRGDGRADDRGQAVQALEGPRQRERHARAGAWNDADQVHRGQSQEGQGHAARQLSRTRCARWRRGAATA